MSIVSQVGSGCFWDACQTLLADAVIVSGIATGSSPEIEDLKKVRQALPQTPILIGSGSSKENIGELLAIADGAIVFQFCATSQGQPLSGSLNLAIKSLRSARL